MSYPARIEAYAAQAFLDRIETDLDGIETSTRYRVRFYPEGGCAIDEWLDMPTPHEPRGGFYLAHAEPEVAEAIRAAARAMLEQASKERPK